jgi:acyl phosphate:glycerol-3-phosphate acyltransferase
VELDWGWVLVAYLLGSVSSAIIVCRLMGLPDPRSEGSGNPGATNVLRIGGKKAAALTLVGDMLKGYIPVALAVWYGLSAEIIIAMGVAAFVGHLWPVFFKFEGGKGVATELGVLFGLHPVIGLVIAGIWLFIAKGLKISSLAALVAMTLAPVMVWFWTEGELSWTLGVALMSLLLIIRHKSNIQRLMSGEETTIGR